MEAKHFTLKEIQSQPNAWAEAVQVVSAQARTLRQLWEDGSYDQVIFTGCGSTYYLSLAAAALFQELSGYPARAVPGGELLLYPKAAYSRDGKILLVSISRSGTTTETIRAHNNFHKAGRGRSVVITNYPESPLAEQGDLVFGLPKGQEHSVAQTRSFASMYVATATLAAILSQREDLLLALESLPEIGERLLVDYNHLACDVGSNLALDRFYFLGSGPRYGLACEVNLKMKEMTLTHSEPFHFLEFRHGPISMITDSATVIGLLSEANHTSEEAVLREISDLGGHVLSLGESGTDVAFESNLPEEIRGVLYLPVLQLMAYYRAIAKDLNPDDPKNLTAVVLLDL
ncbi:MAG: SIS domain-containing protein [Chloroflexota bacterium]|nr:SIS domain-containing protein [Chloroflexota bacterium]